MAKSLRSVYIQIPQEEKSRMFSYDQMPWYIQAYALGFAVMLLMNSYYCAKLKCRPFLLGYELCSGAYMLMFMFAYWNPMLRERLCLYNILPFILILCLDIYFSTWGDIRELGAVLPETSKEELEFAKAFSVLLASPAYVVAALLAWDIAEPYLVS
ncbi:MAG: hypothetical protein A2X49_10925 [Lentisphaerae bacterium GWF2_52_8]|nr:MAG: hypothetical protein A2X49_10925 [Lentisphaerae bacterium GWF2_52_8]